jgi:hypothetical protein
VRIDHDGIEPESAELTGHEERNGAGLASASRPFRFDSSPRNDPGSVMTPATS